MVYVNYLYSCISIFTMVLDDAHMKVATMAWITAILLLGAFLVFWFFWEEIGWILR